jgi:hypothetical protein
MLSEQSGIADGGDLRLRTAIEEAVRKKYAAELSAAQQTGSEDDVEKKIRQEIEEEIKKVSSPYSLWSSWKVGQ